MFRVHRRDRGSAAKETVREGHDRESAAAKRRVKRLFLAEARREHPLWWNTHLNEPGKHDPATRFKQTLAEVSDVLAQRGADDGRALEVLEHLLRKWPGGVLACNAWWTLGTARERGILDRSFMPVANASHIDETSRLRAEMLAAGGQGALHAYDAVIRADGGRR